jgi:hypothetical protein
MLDDFRLIVAITQCSRELGRWKSRDPKILDRDTGVGHEAERR